MSNVLDNKYQKLDIKRCESAPLIEKTSLSDFLESHSNIEDYYIVNKDKYNKDLYLRFHRYSVSNADEIKKEWSQNEPSINLNLKLIDHMIYK